jgi:hypothetical protein
MLSHDKRRKLPYRHGKSKYLATFRYTTALKLLLRFILHNYSVIAVLSSNISTKRHLM